MFALPWKSGPSGPRKPSEIIAGFSPGGRVPPQIDSFHKLLANSIAESHITKRQHEEPYRCGDKDHILHRTSPNCELTLAMFKT
jgi:hypothetical protein